MPPQPYTSKVAPGAQSCELVLIPVYNKPEDMAQTVLYAGVVAKDALKRRKKKSLTLLEAGA